MKGGFETEFNNRYILPSNAYKKPDEDAYKCCDKECNKNLILCKGNKKQHYFRHFAGSNCDRYKNQYLERKPTDNENHEEGKLQLKSWLEQGKNIKINQVCARCNEESLQCCTEPLTINSSFLLEKRSFNGDNPIIYDIAHLQQNNIIEAFEVYSTHLTNENNRPKNIKWYDIKADEINDISYSFIEDKEQIILTNIRFFKCENCIKIEKKELEDDIANELILTCKRQKQQEEDEIIERNKLEKERKRIDLENYQKAIIENIIKNKKMKSLNRKEEKQQEEADEYNKETLLINQRYKYYIEIYNILDNELINKLLEIININYQNINNIKDEYLHKYYKYITHHLNYNIMKMIKFIIYQENVKY